MRSRAAKRSRPWRAALLALAAALACGPGDRAPEQASGPAEVAELPTGAPPVLGSWVVDPDGTSPGALWLVREHEDDRIVFEADRVRLGPTELPVRYEVEGDVVQVVRTDRDARHAVDLLAGDRIRVHFPAGHTAVYRRAADD